MNIFHISISPLGYLYQRLSKMINKHTKHTSRYYCDFSKWRESPYFDQTYEDLSEKNTCEEIISFIKKSDVIVFHQTKLYNRQVKCKDGVFDVHNYFNGKRIFVMIHGQPETLPINIYKTNEFINSHKKKITFLVTTPNQLNLFKDVRLFPEAGLIELDDPLYTPRMNYLKIDKIRIIRCTDWKAQMFNYYLKEKLNKPSNSLLEKFKNLTFYYLPFIKKERDGIFEGKIDTARVIYFNFVRNKLHKNILYYLKKSDILLENDITNYPGGGTSHIIGFEGMAMGLAIVNGATKKNIELLAGCLDIPELPPFPNWENEKDFYLHHIDYLNKLIKDKDYLKEIKKKSREYFVKYLEAGKVIPKIIKILES